MMNLNNQGERFMKKTSADKTILTTAIILALSVIGTSMYYAARATWVFVDITVNIEKFTFILLYVMIINAALLGILLYCGLKNRNLYNNKCYKTVNIISLIIALVLFVAAMVFAVIMATDESSEVFWLYFENSVFNAVVFTMLLFLALFYPFLKEKARKVVIIFVVVFAGLYMFNEFSPIKPYKFTSEPMIINTGIDYSVVFSTSDSGTGYVEYNWKGKSYKVYDADGGRLNSKSKIHSVNVPYEHLDNNSYKIGSVRVLEQYSYGSNTGKEIVSEEYSFNFNDNDELTYLVVSDWHTYKDKAYDAVSYVGEYDAVILMGDSSPGVDMEEQAINNIVEFAGELTKGIKPVLYVRGNHETRGEYAGELLDALGLNEFYYTVDIGSCTFIALDSGEDKDDSHPEYGGMTDYNTYRTDMISWLENVEVENKNVIALSHSWKISDVEKELSEKGWNEIDRLGASLMISGHTHKCRLIGEADDEKEILSHHPEITGYMDGGNSADNYIASKMVVNNKGIELSAYSNFGEKVFEHSLNWR